MEDSSRTVKIKQLNGPELTLRVNHDVSVLFLVKRR